MRNFSGRLVDVFVYQLSAVLHNNSQMLWKQEMTRIFGL
jgi:hypothetical protein